MSTEATSRWHGLHVFYSADLRPMFTECLTPLVRDLRGRGLLAGYFFHRSWLEGPHVRLRLRPATVAATSAVLDTAESAIDDFLARRPAPYEAGRPNPATSYERAFALERADEERLRTYPDGRLPTQVDNTVHHRPYHPEYTRYGGPRGVEVAEWHFEKSSDLVLELLATTDPPTRSALLRLAGELVLITAAAFLRGIAAMTEFAERYRQQAWGAPSEYDPAAYEADYERKAADLAGIHAAVRGVGPALTGFRGRWAEHSAELRTRVTEAARAGELTFPDPAAALPALLARFVHLTNNRLGVTADEEAYLSYLLSRTLRDVGERLPAAG